MAENKIIDSLTFGDSNYTIAIPYGTCSTAAATAAKVVACTNFIALETGASINVKFTYANSVANPTLNVNDTGAKSIVRYGTTKPTASDSTSWVANAIVTFTYDGTYWVMNSSPDRYIGDITGVTAGNGLTGGSSSGSATLNVGAGSGITVGADTVSHADTSTLEGSYGPTADITQVAKTTVSMSVPQITVDGFGHVTGVTNRTFTVTDTNTDTNTWRKVQLNGTDKLGNGTSTNPLNIKAGKDMSITESSGAFTFTGETNFESFGTHSELGSFKYTISSGTYTRSQAFKTIIGSTYFYGFLNVIKNSSGTITGYNIIMWGSATIYYLTYTISSSSWSDTVKYLSTTDHTHSSYAASNHTHTTKIATSSATNELTLAHGTKYAITAGGDSFVFTMPSDNNTHNSHAIISGTNSSGSNITGASSSGNLTLGDSGVTAGTYKRVTVNAKGIVVGGDNTDADTNTWRKVQLNGTDKLGTGTNTNPLNIKAGNNMSITESNGTFTFAATDTNTDTKVTAVGNHYSPAADTSAELTASLSGTAGTYAKDTEYTVLTGVKAQRDAKGHVTGITYTAQKIKDTNTTYTIPTVNNATLTLNVGGQAVSGNNAFTANDATNTTYNVPSATASAYGVVKVSSVNSSAVTVNSESTTAGRYYPVELNSDGKAIVNVPWTDTNTDTNTTYTIATGDSNGQIKVTPSSGSAYNVNVKGLGSSAYTTTYKADDCSTYTSDDGNCTPAAVKKAIGLFEPKAHTHSGYATTSVATTSANGLMSSSDKSKLNGIASGATANTGTVTSVRVQAGTGLSSSVSTAQTGSLNTTISIASGYKLPTTSEWNAKGTSNLTLGTTSTTAAAGNHTHSIYDNTVVSVPSSSVFGNLYTASNDAWKTLNVITNMFSDSLDAYPTAMAGVLGGTEAYTDGSGHGEFITVAAKTPQLKSGSHGTNTGWSGFWIAEDFTARWLKFSPENTSYSVSDERYLVTSTSSSIKKMTALTQSAYDSATKDSSTLYIIS